MIENVPYDTTNGVILHCDIIRPRNTPPSSPAILWIHGGGWMWGNRRAAFERLFVLAQAGFVGVALDYRLSTVATFPAQLEDVRAGIRHVRGHAAQWGIDPEHIGLLGGSCGGHLAALVALRAEEAQDTQVAAVAALFPPTDLTALDDFPEGVTSRMEHHSAESCEGRLLGGALAEREDEARAASPIHWVNANAPPFCLIHGDSDDIVPVTQSLRLHDALKAIGATSELHIVEGGSHGAGNWGRDYLDTLKRFFTHTLLP